MHTKLYARVKRKGIPINVAAEVGVWKPIHSNIHGFIDDGVCSLLVEADPRICNEILEYFSGRDNIKLHAKAIAEERGTLSLINAGSSSFLSHLEASPAIVNDGNNPKDSPSIEVDAVPFFDIDPGNIDLISIDVEGAEWGVISTMKSRPKVISIETHGGIYTNPNIEKITHWMKQNNYRLWYVDKSDSVYVDNRVDLDYRDSLLCFASKIKMNAKRLKKRISRKIKGK